MKNLSIRFIDEKVKKVKGVKYVCSKIKINDFNERFDTPLDYWGIDDYKQQWKEGLERLKTHDVSCLVVGICDSKKGRKYLNWWPLYKEEDTIVVQNGVFYSDFYEEYFGDNEVTVKNCYDFIGPRIPEDFPEGLKPSEWVISLND